MIVWKHYERLLGGTIAARLGEIPTKSQVVRMADATSWSEFVSMLNGIKGFSAIEGNVSLSDIVILAKQHIEEEVTDYFTVVDDERPIALALFPDWFVKDKETLTLEDMIDATDKLWATVRSFDDRYLEAEYDEWYRYLLLFLYKRAHAYGWDLTTMRHLFAPMYMGDKISVLLERGEADPKQVASILGLASDLGDMPILDLEVLVDEYLLLKLSGLSMTSNPLYEIVFYYRALDIAYRNVRIVATGIWGHLSREEIVKRVREVYV
ncbi:hypothetical protein GM182_04040 [bacterium 3DAC]|nr:hypothetical protein [Dictyoglomota bacterium]UZN23072.1 hypothetical protein GM182_04040 [bacterium 3DAC]